MRDVERIDIFCEELAELWKKCPDMRLSQLFVNLQKYCENDLFYYEEDRLMELLKEMLFNWMGIE